MSTHNIPSLSVYAPNFEKVCGAYCFRAVYVSIRLSDACHILRTVHGRVLTFHVWIFHGKIADQYFFSCLSYPYLWSYAPLKNRIEILSPRYLKKYSS